LPVYGSKRSAGRIRQDARYHQAEAGAPRPEAAAFDNPIATNGSETMWKLLSLLQKNLV
jgi:hypothetical protein